MLYIYIIFSFHKKKSTEGAVKIFHVFKSGPDEHAEIDPIRRSSHKLARESVTTYINI